MNPARSLAPAVVSLHFESLWVYLSAPTIGSVAAAGRGPGGTDLGPPRVPAAVRVLPRGRGTRPGGRAALGECRPRPGGGGGGGARGHPAADARLRETAPAGRDSGRGGSRRIPEPECCPRRPNRRGRRLAAGSVARADKRYRVPVPDDGAKGLAGCRARPSTLCLREG
jgi:hypothetical protein